MFQYEQLQRENKFYLAQAFVLFRPPSELDMAYPHWSVPSAVFSLLIMVIISPTTLIDTLRIQLKQMSGCLVVQSGWHIK